MLISEMGVLSMKLKVSTWAVIGIITAFFTPIVPLLIIIGCAIICDTILGVYKAHKLNLPVTSRKMSQLVSKMCLYQFSIISLFILEKYLLGEFTLFITTVPFIITKLATIVLIYIEGKSINEHIIKLYNISIWKSLKELISRTKELKDEIESVKNGNDNISEPPLE